MQREGEEESAAEQDSMGFGKERKECVLGYLDRYWQWERRWEASSSVYRERRWYGWLRVRPSQADQKPSSPGERDFLRCKQSQLFLLAERLRLLLPTHLWRRLRRVEMTEEGRSRSLVAFRNVDEGDGRGERPWETKPSPAGVGSSSGEGVQRGGEIGRRSGTGENASRGDGQGIEEDCVGHRWRRVSEREGKGLVSMSRWFGSVGGDRESSERARGRWSVEDRCLRRYRSGGREGGDLVWRSRWIVDLALSEEERRRLVENRGGSQLGRGRWVGGKDSGRKEGDGNWASLGDGGMGLGARTGDIGVALEVRKRRSQGAFEARKKWSAFVDGRSRGVGWWAFDAAERAEDGRVPRAGLSGRTGSIVEGGDRRGGKEVRAVQIEGRTPFLSPSLRSSAILKPN
jgi:hypothetical protein